MLMKEGDSASKPLTSWNWSEVLCKNLPVAPAACMTLMVLWKASSSGAPM